jgi:superfamily II DNA or RNA helicase
MVTPKTDIEQTVGRILRSNHEQPVVVDIVDTHDLFQKQWAKRKTYYKKEKYAIVKTTSSKYTPDVSKWESVFTPKFEEAKGTTYSATGTSLTPFFATLTPSFNKVQEEEEEEEEEPVSKKSCTIDLSLFD